MEYEPLLDNEPAPLAEPVKRLGAYLVDIGLTILSALPGLFLMLGNDEGSPLFVLGVLTMLVGIFGIAIYQIVLLARQGQTVAKRMMNLRIVDLDDESNPGFVRAVLLRSWVAGGISGIPYIGALFFLVDSIMIFGPDHRCIHDHMANTKVVDESGVYNDLL